MALAYTVAIMTGLFLLPAPKVPEKAFDGQTITVFGKVQNREHRLSAGKKTTVIILNQISQVNHLNQKQSIQDRNNFQDNNNNTDYTNETKTEDEFEPEGLECYLTSEKDTPQIGTYVLLQGKFKCLSTATNPGEFNSVAYYRTKHIQGRLMNCEVMRTYVKRKGEYINLHGDMHYVNYEEILCQLKEKMSDNIDSLFADTDASVVKAMLLGEKAMLDADLKDLYQENGIVHILAISGLHLSILGMGMHTILKKLRTPYAVNIILCVGTMYSYGMMTGMGISVVRALVMFTLRLLAPLAKRTYDMLTAMSVAALLVLLTEPFYLGQSGFLFSFSAICGIGFFLPAVEYKRKELLGHNRTVGMKLLQALISGIAISMSTLPVYLHFYYEFPPYSILLNLFVIPCMTLLMCASLMALLLGMLFHGALLSFLPECFVAVVHYILLLYQKICEWCITLPGNSIVTGRPQWWQTGIYVLLVVFLGLFFKRMKGRTFFCFVVVALLVIFIKIPSGFEMAVLDIGQGDCIYIHDKEGGCYLIDCGSSSKKNPEKYQLYPFLKYKGVTGIDAIIVTHPDSDHISGVMALLEDERTNFTIGTVFLPDIAQESKTDEYRKLEEAASKFRLAYIHKGMILQNGDFMLTCINPEEGVQESDSNVYSTTLYLQYREFTALLTGDLEGIGEKNVVKEWNRKPVMVLKVAHHGSKNSTSEAFLEATKPRVAVISAGENNKYGHPHEELLERLEKYGTKIYRTDKCGAIEVRVKGDSAKIIAYGGK